MATADATTAVEVVEATAIAMTTAVTAEAVVMTTHALTATAMPIVEETTDTVASVVEEATVAAATTGRPVDHQRSQPPAEAMPVILATRHRLANTRSVAATIRIGGEVGSLA